ncbi:MAG TPA: orotidine-5'-phosphate decarboxylase [Lacipirellulaceae bacterium]|jgi:orotidine-5'-phosphate decarboxylase|nr:orotidine-5'-phosphate decarboxylase [Lacipirellulaceae bacterium]
MEHFVDRLTAAIRRTGNAVCVGLDPRRKNLPAGLLPANENTLGAVANAYARFCNGVSDVLAALVPIAKVQAAFFEELGAPGMQAMAEVIDHARSRGLLVIVDAKRNDIGSTAEAYARGYLGAESAWHADALTVSPYLGDDSLAPFVDVARQRNAGIFVLVKTSNPGGRMLQDLQSSGQTIYARVAAHVESLSRATPGECGYGPIGAVVGATYPGQLAELRQAMPHTWFLVPGYGSQGGTAADVAPAFDQNGLGAIINNSRGLIFAHERPEFAGRLAAEWQRAIEAATHEMIDGLHSAGCFPRP